MNLLKVPLPWLLFGLLVANCTELSAEPSGTYQVPYRLLIRGYIRSSGPTQPRFHILVNGRRVGQSDPNGSYSHLIKGVVRLSTYMFNEQIYVSRFLISSNEICAVGENHYKECKSEHYFTPTTRLDRLETNYRLYVNISPVQIINHNVPITACKKQDARFFTTEGGCKDKNTRLVFSSPAEEAHTFNNAQDYCQDLDQGGYADWRLPTAVEMRGISGVPANIHFNFDTQHFFWAATENRTKTAAQAFYLRNRKDNIRNLPEDKAAKVLCVRP